jgi:GST-like protein
LLYLAEKFDALLPADPDRRPECLSWLFWQMGSSPYLGGGFGHFYVYAPDKLEYAIDRFSMEVKRQMDMLNRHLADNQYMCGEDYTIADIAIWPWYGSVVLNNVYDAAEFLDAASYKNLGRWTREIAGRQAVQRGRMVNRKVGPLEEQLRERHDGRDFATKTQDKIEGSS